MSIIIGDGKGKGNKAWVSSEWNRLETSSRSNTRMYYRSRDQGDWFAIISADATANDGEYPLYFKNDNSAKEFVVDEIFISCDQVTTWKIVTATGTATGGSAITPTNLNLSSGTTATATVLWNGAVGWFTAGALLSQFVVGANDEKKLDFDNWLILGQWDAIAFEADDVAAEASVVITLIGYFDAS
jgi:hypothetical protein